MYKHPVIISRVLHPDTGQVIAIEVEVDGKVYFAEPPLDFFLGLRLGPYPNDSNGKPLPREKVS